MALVLILSLLPGIRLTADAATVNYQYGSTSKYSNIIKNWGTREEVATFLSPNAEKFYSDTTYEDLIAKDGSSNLTIVDTSALYIALNQLMKGAHKKTNSYEDTKTLMAFTDIQSNGVPSDKISAFYSGDEVGPGWDSGATWNREHTWPNSKGGSSSSDGGGVNEVDIMMIRPETSSNNSSRGNKAYGVSSAYYNPNLSDTYDVRGDAARTILYVYVRWGTEESEVLNNLWGSDGVFESKDVLLDWMEADPVDTWEMGRNDSVQSITGTRNVFIDYPELAFALFDEEIPSMVTPSGNAGAESYQITARSNNNAYGTVSLSGSVITATPAAGYQVAGYQVTSGSATVIRNGNNFTVRASSDCTVTINFEKAATYSVRILENGVLKASQQIQANQSFTLPAFSGKLPEGYTFAGWANAEVSDTHQKPALYAVGATVPITANATFYAVASYFDGDAEDTENTWTLVTSASQLSTGSEVIIAAKDYDVAMSTAQNSNNRGQAAVTKTGSTLTYDTAVAVFTLENGSISGTYAFNTGSGYLYAVKATSNYLRTQTTLTEGGCFYIAPASDGTCAITSAAYTSSESGVGKVPMQYNLQSSVFACYPKATQKALSLYVGQAAGGATAYTSSWEGGVTVCQHADTSTVTVDATCTANGSVTVSCNTCGEVISVTTIPAGHNEAEETIPATLSQGGYTRYYCTVCGDEYIEDYTDPLTNVEGWNLTLGSDLAVNFKINVDASIRNTAKVNIKVANETTTYNVSQLAGTNNTYTVTVKVAAVQMTDNISVQMVNGDDKTEEKNYSVKAYADAILSGSTPETTKNLVEQMLRYGAAAQKYFGYHTERLADADLAAAAATTPATTNVSSFRGSVDGISYAGATLVFRDKIALRYYFDVTGDIADYTFTKDGKTLNPVKKGTQYYVEIADLNPQDLDQVVTVQVNGTLTATYSPANYMVNMNAKGSESLQALVQALYGYHLAAEAYLA